MSSNDLTIVLVHGAWADGSSWAKIIGPLAADGIKVAAAPLPLTSFRADAAALDRTLERVTGPVVLVGHAYAGAVIAATRSEKVKALVYVAALAPDEGETVADVFYRIEPHPEAPKLAPDGHGLIWLPEGPSPLPSRSMPPRRNWPCWLRCSGRSRPPASLSRWGGRCGRTGRPGSSWPSRTG